MQEPREIDEATCIRERLAPRPTRYGRRLDAQLSGDLRAALCFEERREGDTLSSRDHAP